MGKSRKKGILVLKVGSSVITVERGVLDAATIEEIVRQIILLRQMGYDVLLVSSGAIAAGMQRLGLKKKPAYLPEVQACAAVGQTQLMNAYDTYFKCRKTNTAQILLTQDDINDRTRYLNARNTIQALLKNGAVPIVNENDTVSTEEIKFGDNDRLSGLVANLIEAKRLLILSNVDGLYKTDLRDKTKKVLMKKVDRVTEEVEDLADEGLSKFGTGGMRTKLETAKMVTNSGIDCVILNGRAKGALVDLMSGSSVGTVFPAAQPKISARKRWIAYSSKTAGAVRVDGGAKDVLTRKNRSLLPSGITGCTGKFGAGETVSIQDEGGREFARGISYYSSAEINKIKGKQTVHIEDVLGYKYYDEVVHRDNLVLMDRA